MLKIDKQHVLEVLGASEASHLHQHLQAAIELEHSTIPPYLTALYSLKPGRNTEAARVLQSVVIQEMLHMVIASNVLNAIGGSPVIDKPGFIPVYPGPLPLGVHAELTVGLEKLTRGLICNTFMVIEEPENPTRFVVKQAETPLLSTLEAAPLEEAAVEEYATIGDFYRAIILKIQELGPSIFTGSPEKQVVDNTWFPSDQLFPINSVESAAAALTLIIEQGEGTPRPGTDGARLRLVTGTREESPKKPDDVAHYYRLAQIVYARKLVPDPDEPLGWSYSGAEVGLDPAGVWNLHANAKTADYPVGSRARYLSEQFNYGYTCLLRALHAAFNGRPDMLKSSLGLMYEMRLTALTLVSTPLPGTDLFATPTFEYLPVFPASPSK